MHDEFVKARLLNDSIFPDPLDSNMDNPDGSSLFAEDLVRGYRIDVWNSQSGRWNSLCKRVGCYTFLSKNGEIDISEIEDEGWTSLGITQNPPSSSDNAPNDIYLHESLFHWDGWSLSAPRPGKIIISPKSGVEPGLINEVGTEDYIGVGATENPGEHILPLKTEFAPVRGSLPRLRFDVKYRLRARAVDLAGNGVRMEDLDPEDFTLASPEITYKRFEPVASPILISPKDDEQSSPGSSLERLVISTDCPMDSRWVAPPKVSQLLAETHMMFDRSFGDDPKGKRKAVRERDYEICNRDGMFDPDVSDTTPYLPDPIAMGATVQGFNGKSISHTFYRHHKWPDAEPFLMILEKGDTNKWSYKEEYTSENKKINILRVELAEASTERFLISSALGFGSASRLEMMGIRQWTIDKELPFDDKLALKGKHWMLTPYREIVLVHAVKKPLIEPIPLLLTNSTNLKTSIGQTHADLLGKIYLDGKSTGKVDLVAEWYESIDNPQDNYPKVNALNKAIRMKSHVFEAPINLDGNVLELNGGNVYYSANEKLSSEWANLGGLCPSYPIELKRADVLSLGKFAKKRVAKKSVAYTILSPPRHDFGDTKYRRVEYTPVATTRFREYFNPERNKISADSDSEIEFSRSGPKIVLDIPNSARPPKPKVLYVIPAYGWREEEEFDRVKRYRSGGYLRVYLDRPWFASGDGELLGVVTAQYSPIPRPHSEGFAFKDWGKYDAIDLKGQRFFSGYNEETTFSEKYCIINEGHFRHILINRANRGYLRMNESLILEDGYKLSIKAFFVNKNIFNLELSKDGYFVESKSIEITDGSDNTYYHKIKVNEIHDLVTIAVHFKRSAENLLYDGIWQISDESIFRARTYPNCSNKFLQHITQIGTDPIQKTCKIIDTTQIDLEDCKAESGLMLDELKNPNGSYSEQNKVSVAGYKVGWNEDRGLWYADIKIKPGNSYYPFIRLALVRYQPNSIFDGSDDARISRVTLADFVQIAPDRTATLIWEDIDQNILRVSVSGVAPRQNAPNFYGNLVYVTIEKKVAGIEDENLCWSPVGESIQLESDEITKEIDEQVTWSGVIDIKKHIRSDPIKPGKYRLVIQEKEMYKKDYVGESAIYYQRLVYATTFKL
ncbi:MAG TPA: S-layer protein domain-containing protein [Methanothrix sp.]|nr:S-layer protein domain-containing protein [Methanothrix sp.]